MLFILKLWFIGILFYYIIFLWILRFRHKNEKNVALYRSILFQVLTKFTIKWHVCEHVLYRHLSLLTINYLSCSSIFSIILHILCVSQQFSRLHVWLISREIFVPTYSELVLSFSFFDKFSCDNKNKFI